jgi:steroid 5-alpha reductase family enzyme
MMLYIMILLIFIYFKIARVHAKEEKVDLFWKLQHVLVSIVALLTCIYAFNHNIEWYKLVLVSLLSFMIAGMLITSVQLGIFVDGKPLFGMHKVYKNTIYITILLSCMCVILWAI